MATPPVSTGNSPETGLCWQPPEAIAKGLRPARLWPWLVEPGSLTARLRACCGEQFHVHMLASEIMQLKHDEAAWTHTREAFVREVYLCGGSTPWVHARTIVLNGGSELAWLRSLGTSPLGDEAFEQATTRRSELEVACVPVADGGNIWARRSILRVQGMAFYISEHFIHGLPVATANNARQNQ